MSKTGTARLDRSRSFGEVYGAGDCRYEQDHKEFDGQGRELLKPGAKPAPAVQEFKIDTANMAETVVNPQPEVVDDLTDMTMSELRAVYTAETDQKIKIGKGMNKAKAAAMIREARALKAT